jgi:ABC-2 type transport system permease protein
MRQVLALAMKDLRLLLRDRVGFFFTFFFPLIIGVFFGYVFAGPKSNDASSELRILVADLDDTDASRDLARRLDEHRLVAVEPAGSDDAARASVLAGRRTAAIIIPDGFGAASANLFVGQSPTIQLALDPSRSAEGAMLQGVLMEVAFTSMQSDFQHADRMRERATIARDALQSNNLPPPLRAAFETLLDSSVGLAEQIEMQNEAGLAPDDAGVAGNGGETGGDAGGWSPIAIETVEIRRTRANRPSNAFEVTFPQAMIWGILGSCYGFAMSLVVERTKGTLMRLRVAPVSTSALLLSKALACFLTMLVVMAMLLVIGELFFNVRPQSPLFLAIAILSAAVCFCGMMMLLAVLARTEAAAGGFGWAILLILAMLGGGMIPLFVMPGWMQRASVVSPVNWAIRAMEGAIWRGFSAQQMLTPCAMLLAFGAICFALGVLGFKRLERA